MAYLRSEDMLPPAPKAPLEERLTDIVVNICVAGVFLWSAWMLGGSIGSFVVVLIVELVLSFVFWMVLSEIFGWLMKPPTNAENKRKELKKNRNTQALVVGVALGFVTSAIVARMSHDETGWALALAYFLPMFVVIVGSIRTAYSNNLDDLIYGIGYS